MHSSLLKNRRDKKETSMALIVRPSKKIVKKQDVDIADIKTEIAIAKFEQGFVIKRQSRHTKQELQPKELVPQ